MGGIVVLHTLRWLRLPPFWKTGAGRLIELFRLVRVPTGSIFCLSGICARCWDCLGVASVFTSERRRLAPVEHQAQANLLRCSAESFFSPERD